MTRKIITRAGLSKIVEQKMQITNREATKLVRLFFDELIQTLMNGEDIKLSLFGSFNLKDRKARVGRNPKDGTIFMIPSRCGVTFKSSEALKHILNQPESNHVTQKDKKNESNVSVIEHKDNSARAQK